MPLYAVKNLKTGETQEFMKTLAEYEQWKKENPDWDKDWSKQGRMSVRYSQPYLRGIHGHPDMPDYGKPTMTCLLYTSPSPRDRTRSRMPSSA